MNKSGVKAKAAAAAVKRPGGKSRAAVIAGRAGRFLVTLMLLAVITVCVVVGAVTIYILNFVKPYNVNLSDAKLKFTSIMYANDPSSGKPTELAEISGDENRIWVDLDGVPKNLTNAIISTEDKRFNEHEGIDFKRTAASVANYFLHFYKTNQGGSTLTQQLVKILEGNVNNRNVGNKIREIITSVDVEKKYSKDQILQAYINTIPLGNNCYGVQTAANLYFGKDVKDLDLAQCAAIAAMIRLPYTTYNPYLNPKNVKKRSITVLDNMLSQKMITQAQYKQAVDEKLTYCQKKKTIHSWFVDQVIKDVTSDLKQQKGYSTAYAQQMIYTQGLKIYTTENTTVQAKMDAVYQNMDYFYDGKDDKGNKQYYNSGMMIVDYNGRILGIEGSAGQKTANMTLDRATDTVRQPGSSIKPIAVYAPAIEEGLINWSSIYMDDWVITLNGKQWPKDDEAWTHQNMTVATALTESRNTVAVRIEQLLQPINSYNFLTQKLGFLAYDANNKDATKNGLYKDRDGSELGIALGMLYKGVSVREMAGAYEIFGDGGIYTKPYTYTKVTDSDGNIILQNKTAAKQVISPETATIMNKLMQLVVQRRDGTGYAARLSNCPVAGKTGTTSEKNDRWFVGVTPEYVAAVWTGYDQQKTLNYSGNPAIPIWRDVMQTVETGRKQSSDFPVSGNVIQMCYDPVTGALKANGDPNYTGWYNINDPALQQMENSTAASTASSASSAASSASSALNVPSSSSSSPASSSSSASGDE